MKPMRKLNKIILILLLGVITMNSVGCKKLMSHKALIKQALEEKYNESFEIKESRGSDFFGGYYTAIVYPVERPEVVFQASIDLDGSRESDNYVSKLLCLKLSDTVAKNLDDLKGFYYIFTVPLVENSLLTDKNISLEEYAQKWPDPIVNIYFNYCPDNENMTVDVDEFYETLTHALDGLESFNGSIYLYMVDEGIMDYMQEYRETHDQCYYDYKEKTDRYYLGYIKFEKGKIQITKEDLKKMMEKR